MNIKPHPFVGTLSVCMEPMCFRPENDPIHDLISSTRNVRVARSHAPEPTINSSNLSPDIEVVNQLNHPSVENFEIFKPLSPDDRHDPGPIPEDFNGKPQSTAAELMAKIKEPLKPSPIAFDGICEGHTCPMCERIWQHHYNCQNKKQNGLCENCAQQAAADVNRPKSIEEIAANASPHLPANVAVERMLIGESIVYDMIHNVDGSFKPEWKEAVAKHFLDIQQKIESLKMNLQGGAKAHRAAQVEEMQKLSPQEIEILRKEAQKKSGKRQRQTSLTEPSKPTAPEKKLDKAEARNKLYKSLLDDLSARRPELSKEKREALANKKLAMTEASDDE